MLYIPSTTGARFYNMPDRDIWMNEKRLVKTERQEPSVTTKLSVWPKGARFQNWLASQDDLFAAEKKRDEGGARGTRVHRAVEDMMYGDHYGFEAYADKYFSGETPEERQERAAHEWQRVTSFVNWWNDYDQPTIVHRRSGVPAIECEMYSWQHGFAGTTDAVYTGGKFGNLRVMVDYKTSVDIFDSFWAQLSAYFWAWHEMEEESIDAIASLKLACDSKGQPKYVFKMIDSKKEIQARFEDFLACSRIWKRHREFEKKSTTERTMIAIEPLLKIDKLAERVVKEQEAWEMPKNVLKKESASPASQLKGSEVKQEKAEIDVL